MRKIVLSAFMILSIIVIFNSHSASSENCEEIWVKMVESLTNPNIEEVAGKLTFVRPKASNASRPYESYRLGSLYVFPSISDLQQKYLGREVGFDDNWRMIYATKPNVSGPKEYQTPQHYKYAEEYEKRIKSFKDSVGKHVIAIGRNKKHGEYNYFEIDHIKSLSPVYKWDISEKEKIEFNRIFLPARKDVNFILQVNNPFEQPIKDFTFCISPEYPKLFEFNDTAVKKVSLLKPGESKRLTWNFKIKEAWWQEMRLLVYAPSKPIIASYESLEIVGTLPQKAQDIKKQFDPTKYERQARKAVLDNPPPDEFVEFYNKEVQGMLKEKDYYPTTFSPLLWPSLTFAWKTSSIGRGPVEVFFSSEGDAVEIIYHYYKTGFSLTTGEAIDIQEEIEIVKKFSFIPKEKAVQKSKEVKGGSGNFIYDYASVNLVKTPGKPFYLWKVTYHIKKEVSLAAYNIYFDYIHPETVELISGIVVVKKK